MPFPTIKIILLKTLHTYMYVMYVCIQDLNKMKIRHTLRRDYDASTTSILLHEHASRCDN